MAQVLGLEGNAVAGDLLTFLPHLLDDLDEIVEVALGVDPAREGLSHQFER